MLIQLQGGAATFNQRLDEFFNDPTLQYNFEGAYYNIASAGCCILALELANCE